MWLFVCRQALSTARFRRAGQLATADSCTSVLCFTVIVTRLLCLVGDVAAVPGKLAGELPVVERL